MANELRRAKKKLTAVRRAERRLQHRLDDIDWEEDVLLIELEQLELKAAETLELPEFTIVEDED